MHLHALATAVPTAAYTQQQCWEIVKQSNVRERLGRRSQLMLHAILRGDSGVQTRHFAMPEIHAVFDRSADELNETFRTEAPALASRALSSALSQASLRPSDVDVLLISTCTGYLCPGVTSYVAEQMSIRADAALHDVVGLGCGAAIPTLRAAAAALAANPDAVVACVSVEICSAAFYLDDDPGVLISACLFGDGAAATVWQSKPGATGLRCHGFRSVHQPENRDRIRFEQRDGKLRNLLHPSVPQLAAGAVSGLLSAERARSDAAPIGKLISHTGGRDVIEAIEAAVPEYRLDASRHVLRQFGNMSSPSVLFALEESLRHGRPDRAADWWLVSFGAGFSAHGCRVSAD